MTWAGTVPSFTVNEDLLAADLQTIADILTALTGPWTPYTPALTNVTIGNGSIVGSYTQVGKFVTFRWTLTRGSTTSFTGSIAIGLPVAGLDAGWAGVAFLFQVSPATNRTPGVLNGSTTANNVHGSGGIVNATSPWTWTTADVIKGSGTYEAA